MDINKCIKIIENSIKDPTKGLPEDIFLFLTRLSPLINVDLLIKNPQNQTLLTWRQAGQSYGPGWHVPGGIVRYKEKISNKKIKYVGIRPGEKLHEILINKDETRYTYEFKNKFIINYQDQNSKKRNIVIGGKKVKENFEYSSQNNTFLNLKQISRFIE